MSRFSVNSIRAKKKNDERLVVTTAYDATIARLVDPHVDIILVGDSLGMVIQGHADTVRVTLEHMVYHCACVQRATERAHLVGDLPFMSYQLSTEQALASAGRLLQEGAVQSVKLEGGRRVAGAVARLVEAGIPVMGHIGLTPQSVHALGGFELQGRGAEAERQLIEDALALEHAGAYAIVIEMVPAEVAGRITSSVSVPTIGIGAGVDCDGQVLVSYDLLGLNPNFKPRFVKRYAELGAQLEEAIVAFADDVRALGFPGPEHGYREASGAVVSDDDSPSRRHPVSSD